MQTLTGLDLCNMAIVVPVGIERDCYLLVKGFLINMHVLLAVLHICNTVLVERI